MSLRFYMDVQVPAAVTRGLRRRGIDVLRAQDDGASTSADDVIIDRATELNRLSVSQDSDFLRVAAARQRSNDTFSGVIYASQRGISYATFINDLEIIAKAMTFDELRNSVTYLPL